MIITVIFSMVYGQDTDNNFVIFVSPLKAIYSVVIISIFALQ